jgi:hypothetical protein
MKDGIEVVIMCREREREARRAIQALSIVDFGVETKIIVSDNPSSAKMALTDIPKDVSHIVRDPSGSWNWHFNSIVSELEYEWCLITHDDDEILPILGKTFQTHKDNSEVFVITGLSQIVDHKNGPIFDQGYDTRINSAGLRSPAGAIYTNLSGHLFDLGTLFPASAMIIRSSLLQSLAPLDVRFELTADFGLSILVAHNRGVVFEGSKPIMNYNLHKNNSVFTDDAAGGIMADFTVTRILLLEKFNELYTESRMTMLLKSVVMSRILIAAFGLTQRKKLLKKTISGSDLLKRNKLKYFLMSFPIFLGPLAPFVRKKVRARLGI